ncbi:MAG: acyl-CoA dehydrogenase family protein [Meiothermus sp.]|uniref:acyl-CoA dehydrogenase family protein n=1 Tax=Meiothermus sp. TaxID=1955249 RepID=UPI0025F91E3F|nr:acyl-CoA dehydrogenase family protein [Meiothermus sp.]MCS7057852.1 acyl-CoA dehydrogenase family protein [Meiothermus sp.]MCS7194272.1 acyl-CoA dehydrogenase family protein [Meiothermus sp.]MCX7739944.1 acyl-CoA dehydrogenase family protein [Meiothermus sp.]MDW8090794.1 acyl-CoA dehydrogenase family protein [Meiothermus sp.]MDW8480783.1 acyl-CoA dehydrogenase family protein [Meiothermus sp.]
MPVDFSLTEEQRQLQKLARRFAREQIAPIAAEYDAREEVPWQVVERLHEVGLLNAIVPEEYGGMGLGMLEEVIIGEELAWGCMGIYTIAMASDLGITPLLLAGTQAQKARFLRKVTQKPALAAFALSEPGNGSDAAALRTRAVREGDYYVLNGTKTWISNGGEAEWVVVFATVNPEARHRGVVALVVEKGTPGFTAHKLHGKMGQRASGTYELVFEDCRVPAENLLGQEGDGFKIAMRTLDKTRIPVAAGSVGVARRALEEATRYAKEREAFGKPIAQFQAIQFKLAEMLMGIETARAYTYYAAWLVDTGQPHSHAAAIAKAYASEMAFSVANQAIQIHGGYGYMREYPVEKLLRDVKLNQIYEGTNEIQRLIIARHILGQ